MRTPRASCAVLAVVTATALALTGCGSDTGGAAVEDRKSLSGRDTRTGDTEFARLAAKELEKDPQSATVIKYGSTVQLDMTDPGIQLKTRNPSGGDVFGALVREMLEEHRDWTPKVDIKIDNARVLGDAYICMDFDLANNIPPMSVFSGKKKDGKDWTAYLPSAVTLGRYPKVHLSSISQYVNGNRELLESVESLPVSKKVEYGLPGLTYDEATLTRPSSGVMFAELGEHVDGGHAYDGSRDEAADGDTTMPAGGRLTMTRCWSVRDEFGVALQGEDYGKLPESRLNGAFAVGIEISVAGHGVGVSVPFGLVS